NNTEDRAAFHIIHLDADLIAVTKERCLRRAMADRLDRADFRDAGVPDPTLADRLTRAAVRIAVRDRARADDHAIEQRARLCRMRDQRREIEGHVDARIGPAERLAVDG